MKTSAILLSAAGLAFALVLPAAAQCPSKCSDKAAAQPAQKASTVAAPAQDCHGQASACSGESKAQTVANGARPSMIDEVQALHSEVVLARAELSRLESELAGLRLPAAQPVSQQECCEEQSACCEPAEACCDQPAEAQTVASPACSETKACDSAKQCEGQKACDSQAAQTVAAGAQECCEAMAQSACEYKPAAQAVALQLGDCESVTAQLNGLRAELGQVRARISAAAAQVARLRAASAGAPMAAR